MNLIEQLGGYAQAKALRELPAATYDCGIKFNRAALENAMLQYRRQNNIFEVGDVVVLSGENSTLMYKLHERIGKYVYLKRPSGREYEFHIDEIRHATPEEIKAGKRL